MYINVAEVLTTIASALFLALRSTRSCSRNGFRRCGFAPTRSAVAQSLHRLVTEICVHQDRKTKTETDMVQAAHIEIVWPTLNSDQLRIFR